MPTTLIWDGKPPTISNLLIRDAWNSSILNPVYINAFLFENVKFTVKRMADVLPWTSFEIKLKLMSKLLLY